jgi:hypothetical protein
MPRFDPAMPLVHPLPDPGRVEVRAGLGYAGFGGRELAMDLYLPAGRDPGALPAVLLVHGEAPPELLRGVLGWGQYQGWGRLLAGEGLAGVAFEHSAVAEAGFEAVAAQFGRPWPRSGTGPVSSASTRGAWPWPGSRPGCR